MTTEETVNVRGQATILFLVAL